MCGCSQEGWLDVVVHYTGGRHKQKQIEDEEPTLRKIFSGDSVPELMHSRPVIEGPVKTATALQDGHSLKR